MERFLELRRLFLTSKFFGLALKISLLSFRSNNNLTIKNVWTSCNWYIIYISTLIAFLVALYYNGCNSFLRILYHSFLRLRLWAATKILFQIPHFDWEGGFCQCSFFIHQHKECNPNLLYILATNAFESANYDSHAYFDVRLQS